MNELNQFKLNARLQLVALKHDAMRLPEMWVRMRSSPVALLGFEVVQHHRRRQLVQHGLKRRKHREVGVNLHMLAKVFDAVVRPPQRVCGQGRVVNTIGFEVDTDTAHASVTSSPVSAGRKSSVLPPLIHALGA